MCSCVFWIASCNFCHTFFPEHWPTKVRAQKRSTRTSSRLMWIQLVRGLEKIPKYLSNANLLSTNSLSANSGNATYSQNQKSQICEDPVYFYFLFSFLFLLSLFFFYFLFRCIKGRALFLDWWYVCHRNSCEQSISWNQDLQLEK